MPIANITNLLSYFKFVMFTYLLTIGVEILVDTPLNYPSHEVWSSEKKVQIIV